MDQVAALILMILGGTVILNNGYWEVRQFFENRRNSARLVAIGHRYEAILAAGPGIPCQDEGPDETARVEGLGHRLAFCHERWEA